MHERLKTICAAFALWPVGCGKTKRGPLAFLTNCLTREQNSRNIKFNSSVTLSAARNPNLMGYASNFTAAQMSEKISRISGLGQLTGSACRLSAASKRHTAEKPRDHASWGGRSKLAAASFGSCAGGLNGPQRSGACCDACT